MNKYPIVALVPLLAGIALILNCGSISCPFAADSGSSHENGSCSGNCGANCGNCSGNSTCLNEAAGAQNNSTQENCTAVGSCPVKAVQ